MNSILLNEMIDYIENNLTEEIDYKQLSKIVGVSEYSLQRIFIFMTNISIAEYIRKRRLSKAFEELKQTDIKVIDLAMKYKYNSAISFTRAFKQHFNMTPTECRNNNKKYTIFPIIKFQNNMYDSTEINYEIKNIDEKILYYNYKVCAKRHDDLLFKIRQLYKNNSVLSKLNNTVIYGISTFEDKEYGYYIGTELKLPNSKNIKIEKGKYAIFEAESQKQNDIVKVYDFVYHNWINSTNYDILDKLELEVYNKDKCYIYFKIKDKQN